jgi:hypothetical protein
MEGAVDDIIKLNAHLGMPPNLHVYMLLAADMLC